MKARVSLCIPVSFLFICSVQLPAQDLSNLFERAHYPLINSSEDILGQFDSIQLFNAPYNDQNGVYSNGIYVGNDPVSGCQILTPHLDALYDSVFAVQVEFQFTDLDGMLRPVLVLGKYNRYLGFEVLDDNTFAVLFNNDYHYPIGGITPQEGVFYTLTFIHHALTPVSECYLNGDLVEVVEGALVRPSDDGFILNENQGLGLTFKGYLRNLRVYASGESTAIYHHATPVHELMVFPNPVRSSLEFVQSVPEAKYWSISCPQGSVVMKGDLKDESHTVDVHSLPSGIYFLHLNTTSGAMVAHQTFFKI